MSARVYASLADYEAYMGATVSDDDLVTVTRRLQKASLLLETLLIAAVYPTDDDGYPTDQRVAAVLSEAVCAQVAWFDEVGDDTGASETFGGGSLGSLSLPKATGAATSRYAPDSVLCLVGGGLIGTAVFY